MALNSAIPLVTVNVGQFLDQSGAADWSGTVTFTPAVERLHIPSGDLLTATPIDCPVAAGVGSVQLVASDAPDMTSAGVQYHVSWLLTARDGTRPRPAYPRVIYLPAAVQTVDLELLQSALPAEPGSVAVPVGVQKIGDLSGAVTVDQLSELLAPSTLDLIANGGPAVMARLPLTSAAEDTAALTAAFNAARPGRTVLLRTGTYTLAPGGFLDIPDGVNVVAQPGTVLTGSAPLRSVLSVGTGTTIEGLTVVNTDDGVGGNIAVSVRPGSSRIRLERCRFTGGGHTQGLQVGAAGVSDVDVDRCDFSGLEFGILTNGQGVGGADDLIGVRVTASTFTDISSDGIEFNHPGDTFSARTAASGFIVDDCRFVRCGEFGVGVAGAADVTIKGSTFSACGRAIHIEDQTYGFSVGGNTIDGTTAGLTGGDYGAIEVLSSDGGSIDDNTIRGAASHGILVVYDNNVPGNTALTIGENTVIGAGGDGIRAGGNTSAGQQVIVDNIVRGCAGNGIRVSGDSPDVLIDGNIATGNGGYGLDPGGQQAQRTLGTNIFVGNTLGAIAGKAISAGVAACTPSRVGRGSNTPSTGADAVVPLFSAGMWLDGRVFVTAQRATARADAVFAVTWDGTTLTANRKAHRAFGVLDVYDLRVVDGVLCAIATTTGTGPVLADGRFVGLALEDSVARTGTVSSIHGPTVAGAKGGNAALTSLIAALVAQGLIVDTTT